MKLTNLEKTFKASQETLNQFLITELPINIFLIDTEGYVCWANKNLLNFVNINSLQEVLGVHISHWDKCRWDAIQDVLKTKQETVTEEFYNETYFSSIRKPVIQDGKLIGVLGLSIDITEKKQAEIAKQQFIMNMAHDLRTPLSGIIGIAGIQADQGTSLQDKEFGVWTLNAGRQLLELLNAVLEVISTEHMLDSMREDYIDFSLLAKELQNLIKPAIIAKNLKFEWILDSNLPSITSDQIKLKRILLNLLSNAIKFTNEGKISLKINLLDIKDNQAKIEMCVSDTGIGIAKGELDKIFDRFYRTHPSYEAEYKGYGIGLFLVKKSVALLGGQINVSSEEGKGSHFTLVFDFPLAEVVDIQKNQPLEFVSHSAKKLEGSVLVAEDNKLVSHIVNALLSDLGYHVVMVTNGKDALHALQTQNFNWVLLDIGLPDLLGTEVAKHYRQWEKEHRKPRLPLFALTAHKTDEVKEQCEEAGIDYILNKPFTHKDIQIIKLFMENKK